MRVRGKFTGRQATALRWDGKNIEAITNLVGVQVDRDGDTLLLLSDEGVTPLCHGDWVIQPDDHEWFTSCSDAMFDGLLEEIP